MRRLDQLHLQYPYYGARRLAYHLTREGLQVSRKRVGRLMGLMGLGAVYQKPRTSLVEQTHKRYPYLLRSLPIIRANQVWAADITYIPMAKGFFYLVAILEWYSRKVLSWRLSNTLDHDFCQEALQEALRLYGFPEIFNSDQGRQFTSKEFTAILECRGIKISMDGKGRWLDNVLIERLWRSLKYECVYLHAFTGGHEARKLIGVWMCAYNQKRPHLSLNGLTPDEVYYAWAKNPESSAVGKALGPFPQLNNSNNDDYPTRLTELCSPNS